MERACFPETIRCAPHANKQSTSNEFCFTPDDVFDLQARFPSVLQQAVQESVHLKKTRCIINDHLVWLAGSLDAG